MVLIQLQPKKLRANATSYTVWMRARITHMQSTTQQSTTQHSTANTEHTKNRNPAQTQNQASATSISLSCQHRQVVLAIYFYLCSTTYISISHLSLFVCTCSLATCVECVVLCSVVCMHVCARFCVGSVSYRADKRFNVTVLQRRKKICLRIYFWNRRKQY